MKTMATINQLKNEHNLSRWDWAKMFLLSAWLLLGWLAVNQAVKVNPAENVPPVSVAAIPAPYDFAHNANYRVAVLSYTSQNGMRDFPF